MGLAPAALTTVRRQYSLTLSLSTQFCRATHAVTAEFLEDAIVRDGLTEHRKADFDGGHLRLERAERSTSCNGIARRGFCCSYSAGASIQRFGIV
jgi:hypothetical protein